MNLVTLQISCFLFKNLNKQIRHSPSGQVQEVPESGLKWQMPPFTQKAAWHRSRATEQSAPAKPGSHSQPAAADVQLPRPEQPRTSQPESATSVR